jgi:hypothetical protein
MDKVAEKLKNLNIHGLLLIGGFEVRIFVGACHLTDVIVHTL